MNHKFYLLFLVLVLGVVFEGVRASDGDESNDDDDDDEGSLYNFDHGETAISEAEIEAKIDKLKELDERLDYIGSAPMDPVDALELFTDKLKIFKELPQQVRDQYDFATTLKLVKLGNLEQSACSDAKFEWYKDILARQRGSDYPNWNIIEYVKFYASLLASECDYYFEDDDDDENHIEGVDHEEDKHESDINVQYNDEYDSDWNSDSDDDDVD